MEKVLLLNASYEPLNICSWKRALVLMLKGKAEKIEHYESMINDNIQTPSVIRLRYYVVVPYRELPFSKKNVLQRDNYTCQYCGKQSKSLTIDHIIPKSKGGPNTWENVVAACSKCNSKKADKNLKDTNIKLAKKPQRPKNYIKFKLQKYSSHLDNNWEKYCISNF